ncbi:MAG: hypothetical protein ACYDAY_02095 [Candidatus Dormibacteria bacterium]
MADIRILSAGVDTLYISLRADIQGDVLAALAAAKSQGQASGEEQVATVGGRTFLPRTFGWRGYPYWLMGAGFDLCLGAASPFPAAYVMLRSAGIHTHGVEYAAADALKCVSRVAKGGRVNDTASRIDVYADITGLQLEHSDIRRFVCRARSRRLFQVERELHHTGSRLSGFIFGKGDVVGRIYDKTIEMRATGDTWPKLFWSGVKDGDQVWRVEFQFRRPVLSSFGLHTSDEVITWRKPLWDYGCGWLSLREPSDHERPARWPEDPDWAAVAAAKIGSPANPLVRKHRLATDEERLLRGWTGYTTSIAALTGTAGLTGTLLHAASAAREHLEHQGTSFDEVVARKRRRREALAGPLEDQLGTRTG